MDEKKYVIIFKNGKETKVSQDTANILQETLNAKGSTQTFQTFVDMIGNVFLIVKIPEIVCLSKIENVV